MKEIKVLLNKVSLIKEFVDIVCKFDMDVDIVYGRYIIDAKSIMGIFSLDLLSPIKLTAHSDDVSKLFEVPLEYEN